MMRRIFVKTAKKPHLFAIAYLLSGILSLSQAVVAVAQTDEGSTAVADSSSAKEHINIPPISPQYAQVQRHLARGWNTWDVHSVITHVLLPEGLAIHIGLEHNSTEGGDAFLA